MKELFAWTTLYFFATCQTLGKIARRTFQVSHASVRTRITGAMVEEIVDCAFVNLFEFSGKLMVEKISRVSKLMIKLAPYRM